MRHSQILRGISEATRALLDIDLQENAIQAAVAALGSGSNVDRCYIFQIEGELGDRTMSQRFEWVKGSVSVQIDNPRLQDIPEAYFPWLMEKLDRDEILYGIVAQSDDAEFKESLAEQDIKSYLFTPIQKDGQLWGFIGYDDCKEERDWMQVEADALATVAKNIGIRLSWDSTKKNLEERNEIFEIAVKGARLGLWEWLPATGRVYPSEAYARILGYPVSDLTTYESWASKIHPDDLDGVLKALNAHLQDGEQPYDVQYRCMTGNGEYRWVASNGMAKRDADNKVIMLTGFLRDIHDQIIAEEARIQALQRMLELNELKSNFVSMASHQFRTPLTVIYSNVELMEMVIKKLEPSLMERFSKGTGRIKDEVTRMTELMNNILTFGKYEAGLMTVRMTSVDLVELIHRINEQYFSQEADGRKIGIAVQGKARNISCDSMLLTHAFSNLMSNALKYSPQRPAPRIEIHFLETGVEVSIIDYGIGIPEKDKVNAFNSFFRATNASTIVGSGLGLPIVKEFVERHGGKVSFDSVENKGSTFTVHLPYEQA